MHFFPLVCSFHSLLCSATPLPLSTCFLSFVFSSSFFFLPFPAAPVMIMMMKMMMMMMMTRWFVCVGNPRTGTRRRPGCPRRRCPRCPCAGRHRGPRPPAGLRARCTAGEHAPQATPRKTIKNAGGQYRSMAAGRGPRAVGKHGQFATYSAGASAQ